MFSIFKRSQILNQTLKIVFPVEKIAINRYCTNNGPTAIRRIKSKTKNSGVSFIKNKTIFFLNLIQILISLK